jgi:hypothetical protein
VRANFFKSTADKGANVSTVISRARALSRALGLCVIVGGAGLMASCHSNLTEGRAPVILVIDSLLGSSAQKVGQQGTFENVLRSDVETKGSVFEDPGRVTMHIELKDITGTGPTSNNNVTINHYRVQFRRTDGRNIQGVDVPYAFEGASTFTVTPTNATAGFVLVRVQSKLEPPLITLAGGGGSIVISTIADVTFYGKDTTGTDVTVTGSISVNFADWADPAS